MTKDSLSDTAALRAFLSETPDTHLLAEMLGFVADRLMALDVDQLCGAGAHGRNVEVMWLTGRLVPDHRTIADFLRDNGPAIRRTCAQFIELCRRIGVLTGDCVAIDGSKFKAVNNRDKNFTKGKIASRIQPGSVRPIPRDGLGPSPPAWADPRRW